jgi:type I restriction enzyme S subunit
MSDNVPAIRFVGFAEPWEQRQLGEVAQFNPVSDLPSEFEYVDLESVVGTEMIGHRHETRESAPSRAQRLARAGDIFYQAVRPYQKNNYLYEKPDEGYVFSTGYVQMRPHVNGSFLFSTLQRDSFVDEVLNHCTGTSYPAINSNDLANIVVSIPSDEREQALIGNAIRTLDNLITLHQRKHDQLATLKKSLLEKMFPMPGSDVPELRFAGFAEPWEQRKLGDIAEIIGGGTPDTSNPDYWDGDIDWYSPAEIGGQVYADGSIRKITKAGYSNSSAKMLPANKTILFTSRAGIGTTAILRRSACTNQGFQSLVVEDGTSVYFLYSLSGRIKKYAEVKAAGSTFLEISGKQLADMDLLLPSLAEQCEIGALFQCLDNLITLHQRKHDQLATLKKSLLEKMFV